MINYTLVKRKDVIMKKSLIRTVSLVMGAIFCVFSFASCSKEPYDYELDDYITIPADLSGITVTEAEIEEAVANQIQSALKAKGKLVEENEVGARNGHTLKISFICKKTDGKNTEIPELSDSDCTIVLGEGKYPAPLEESLMRKIVGDEFKVTVTLPDTFTALGLAGKTIIYEGRINQIYRTELDEYNAGFVQSISEYQTEKEYEQYLYERMKEELIFEKLLELSKVKSYPKNELKSYTDSFAKYHTEQAEALGIPLEQYVAKKYFISITDFHLKEDEYAKDLVKRELLLYSLARKNGIELTEAQYNAGATKYVKQYGLDNVAELEGKFGSANVRQTVLMDKVLAYLSEQVTVTKTSAA